MPRSFSLGILLVGCGLGSNSNMGTIYRIRAGFIFPQPSCDASGVTGFGSSSPVRSSSYILTFFYYLQFTTGKKYPIYGTQWHPEKLQFEWEPKEAISHSPDAILVGQYMANFFVKQGTQLD